MVFFPALLLLLLGADGNVVTVEVIGATWCPHAIRIINAGLDTLQRFGGLHRVNYSYYPENDCRHGQFINYCASIGASLQGCLKKYLNNKPEDYMQALGCCQGDDTTAEAAIECIKKTPVAGKLNMDRLKACAGKEGREYLADEANEYNRIPWAKVNGEGWWQAAYDPWGAACKYMSPKAKECP